MTAVKDPADGAADVAADVARGRALAGARARGRTPAGTRARGRPPAGTRDFAVKVNLRPALDEMAKSFKAAMTAVRRLKGRDTHRVGGLTYAQYGLLFALADSGSRSAREIAFAADLTPATVTQMLDSLATAGLVARVRSTEDRRVVLTSLTKRGQSLVQERRSDFEKRWTAAVADFSDEELRTAGAVLERLAALFDELAEYRDAEVEP
jgi:DNA-binding MarR family transcriptional regulator